MAEVSEIKVDVGQELQHLSAVAAHKFSWLCDIVVFTADIKNLIAKEELLGKLKKLIDQQALTKSKSIRDIVETKMNIRCYNSNLTWEKAYFNLDNFRIAMRYSFKFYHPNSLLDTTRVISGDILFEG